MLTYSDLKKGVKIILDGQPYELLETNFMKKAQRRPVIQTKIKNLITGNVVGRNFQQGDVFEEPDLEKIKAKFIYAHRERFFFSQENEPAKRFELTSEQIGPHAKFLKQNQAVDVLLFNGGIINIALPIKIQLRVKEAPPGIVGDRAQGGNKIVTLETGAKINAPLFIKTDDIIEINTETEEYVRRI